MQAPLDAEASMKQKIVLAGVYPDVAVRLIRTYQDMLEQHKMGMRLASGSRSWAEQAKLYAQGRTAPGAIVTNAPAGYSNHNFYCAADSCFVGTDPWLEHMGKTHAGAAQAEALWAAFGKLGQAHGLEWGGAWHTIQDRPHMQMTYGYSLEQMRAIYKQGGVRGLWTAFDKKRGVTVGSEWASYLPMMGIK